MARNPWVKARKEFSEELLSSAKGVNSAAQQILINASSMFLDYVQMNKHLLPIYTSNLHDSIATSVSMSGRILRANYMPQEATRPQTAPGRKRIIGAQEAERAVRRSTPKRTGLSATLFVSVPYAEGANIKSKNPHYYEWLQSAFESDMKAAVETLSVIKDYNKVNVPVHSARRFE